MNLIRDAHKRLSQSVIMIGNFDGVHIGHQQLIHALITSANELKIPSILLTFEPNPSEFFPAKIPLARLMRFSEKWRCIQHYGIDYFYCMRFNAPLANLSPDDFVKKILVDQLGVKKIIVGDDFRFGAKRAGNVETLKTLGKKQGFEVEALPQAMHNDERISSTCIRHAVKQGDFETAKALMGRPFTLSGKVSYGSQLGRQLGFPTANIHLHRKHVPMMGIFVVRVYGLRAEPLNGVASIGYRPTLDGKKILLEVHLFDFDEMIYGRFITVEFLHKIRDEVKFESVPELVLEIDNDVKIAKKYFMISDH